MGLELLFGALLPSLIGGIGSAIAGSDDDGGQPPAPPKRRNPFEFQPFNTQSLFSPISGSPGGAYQDEESAKFKRMIGLGQ